MTTRKGMEIKMNFKEVAIKASKEAGKLLMDNLENQKIIGETNKNPVTKQDKDSELLILKIIKQNFPTHGFLGEEFGEENKQSRYKWIIDPIDGTNNYLDGRDTFSISIGLEYKKDIILGVVYLPKRKELFVAEKNKGTTLNNKKVFISKEDCLKKSIITYSTYPGNEKETKNLDKNILTNIPNIKYFGFENKKDIDNDFGRGSMAAEFCYLACGRIDGLMRFKQKPWDVAAGTLIAKEAGAILKNLKGKEPSIYKGDYIAGNKELVTKLVKLVN